MDRQTFEALLDEHRDRVYGYARHLVGNDEDAEDVTQEVFVRLWRKRATIEVETARYWLLRVCRNLCLDGLRRRRVRARARDASERGHVGIEVEEDEGRERSLEVSDKGVGALHTEQALDVQRMVRAMEGLKEPHRSIILLREVQDLSYDEIAETLGLSLSAVKVYLHRARKRIRESFLDQNEALDQQGHGA